MNEIVISDKVYRLDEHGFLEAPDDWDRTFAEGMAQHLGITGGLTERHWDVIDFIREYVETKKDMPFLYQTCRETGVSLENMKALFPTGYHRGACRIAGVSHGFMAAINIWFTYETTQLKRDRTPTGPLGFLKDALTWNREFAEKTAADHGIAGGLTGRHWQVVESIRERYAETGTVPLVYEICERNGLTAKELMVLFPRGYHRGACKIAGLHPHA